MNGCHASRKRGLTDMAGVARDRLTVDLRGIGSAVRTAAGNCHVTLATFARDAIVEALRSTKTQGETSIGSDIDIDQRDTAKITLRMTACDAEVLVLKSAALGLSYGAFVGRLARGTPLPALAADRADRAVLLRSADRLALLAVDLHALIRMLRTANSTGAERYRASAMAVAEDVHRHLHLASKVLARVGDDL